MPFFVRHLIQNLSGTGGRTSSYIATNVVFKSADVHKYPNEAKDAFDKMEIPLRVQVQMISHYHHQVLIESTVQAKNFRPTRTMQSVEKMLHWGWRIKKACS